MKRLLAGIVIALTFAMPSWTAKAGTSPNSVVWSYTGVCNSTDQVTSWTITGPGVSGYKITSSWLNEPIHIIGFDILQVTGGAPLFWAIGSFIPRGGDMLMWTDQRHAVQFFPAGISIPVLPSTGNMFDLHGSCSGGAAVTIFLTVYFTYDVGP